jgi:hypothetical protein
MAKGAYQGEPGDKLRVLRGTGPAIRVHTQRVRLTLTVAEGGAEAPIGETVTGDTTAAIATYPQPRCWWQRGVVIAPRQPGHPRPAAQRQRA